MQQVGAYIYRDNRPPRFQRVKAPAESELKDLVQLISQRVGRCLERQGLLEQDAESAWLELEPADDTDAMPHLRKKEQDISALPLLAPPSRAPPENLPLFAWKGAW